MQDKVRQNNQTEDSDEEGQNWKDVLPGISFSRGVGLKSVMSVRQSEYTNTGF